MIWILTGLAIIALITVFYLRGQDLAAFDSPEGQSFSAHQQPSPENEAVLQSLAEGMGSMADEPGKVRLRLMRKYMDGISDGQDIRSVITPVDINGLAAEWVLAEGADTSRRVLYIHGGAFMMGSPRSHRNITSRFSEVAGAAVLAIDYRLMPENRRMAGVEDCREAYQWLLQNGPEGPGAAQRIYIGGDSAGGNLTLSLIAWLRDQNLRQADAAVALSPVTDTSFGSPSLERNLEFDAMLGPMFKRVKRIPRSLLLWISWAQNRVNPSNPVVSPVFGDLSNLPPTLVHASESEVLYDDAKRYVNRAVAAGSPARLQSWDNMVHVWQMFYPQLQEACSAWDEIGSFIAAIEGNSQRREKAA